MSIRIGLGLAGFPFSSPAAFWRWVDLCEDSEIDSIWLSERPVASQPYLEPVSAFAMMCGRTQRLKFGMNTVILPLRDPLLLARECATIDYLSGGRLLPAFGVGRDNAPEWAASGKNPAGRGERANEMLQLMPRLWSEDSVDFEGKHFSFKDATVLPHPRQQPLPLWIGGSSIAAVKRTALYGTGWLGGIQNPAQVAPVITAIKAAAAEAGRTIDSDHYGANFAFRFGDWDEPVVQRSAAFLSRLGEGAEPRSFVAVGRAEIVERAREFAAAGVSKFVLRPIGEDDEDIMEQTHRLNAEVLPTVHAEGWFS